MRVPRASFAFAFLFVAVCGQAATAQEPAHQAFGIAARVPWTTSRVVGSPEPPSPYRTEAAFPVNFNEPLEAAIAPGLDRLFVVERYGKIFSFANDPAAAEGELFLDLGKVIYSLAFHPRFAENGYVYLTYMHDITEGAPNGTRVSRFTVRQGDPLHCDPASEQVVIEWLAGGHNGGCLRFGPDGYLYIVIGDGSGIADEHVTGQDVTDLLASMLRIDVDHPSDGRAYGIPADNPLLKVPNARPEIYAFGLRQSWKFSFDRATGDLWAGEVGQDLWEMVYRIVPGGNYGWSVQEGRHPFRPTRPRGPGAIQRPIVEHPHSDFRSITGGYVYRGSRLPELAGAYIYADYDTGRVWSLRYDGRDVTEHRELVDTPLRIVSIVEDAAGELFLVDHVGGQLHRLIAAPPPAPNRPPFPRLLSETGLFESVAEHKPAPGLIPYAVNSPLWSDGAIKERLMALPGESQIVFDGMLYPQPAPGAPHGWKFPDGTVLVKTFSLEMQAGDPASRRRVETRLLHFEQLGGSEEVGDQYWKGYSYVWNDEQTDAVLVETQGVDRDYTIADSAAPGGSRVQKWHFPSRAECTLCHTMAAKYVLGVNTAQMNREFDYGGTVANQLATLEHLGVFTSPLPAPPAELPRLYDHNDPQFTLDQRARSYLESNCAHCHRKWGGGNAEFRLLATLPLEETGTVNVRAGHGNFNIAGAALLAPGKPELSLIHHRMTRLGLGRMPHVASNIVDAEAVKLIEEWIKGMGD